MTLTHSKADYLSITRTRAILVLALACPCFVASAEPIQLQLRWHHQFQFAGYYAALEQGYYKKAGLDVIIHEGTPEKKPVQEVLQGHAQYGEANSELLLERLRGAPLVALAAIYQHSPSVLIARKDAGISSPDDLVGKKIMLMDQTVDADFVAMFNNEGIDMSRLHVIPSSYEIHDLADGKVDAFNSYLSNEPYFLKQQGIEFSVLNPRNYGVDFYSDILFTTEDELKQHPERVKAFRQASLEGWYYAMDHPQEIIDLLLDKYKVDKSRAHLEFEADAIRSLIIPDVIDLGHMNPWRWRHMAETFIKAGMVKNDQFLQDFSYDPAPKADKEQLLRYIKITVGISLFTGVITLTLLAAYRTLKRKNKLAARNEKLLRNRTDELALRNQILQQINQGLALPKVLNELALQVETLHPDMLCSILLLDEDKHLRHGAAPSLPDFYNQAIDGVEIGVGVGSCGTAAHLGERVIVEDIQRHPYWEPYRKLAKLANLQACWSEPIKNNQGQVLGTFAVYHRLPVQPSDAEVTLIEHYAGLAQLAIERNRSTIQIAESLSILKATLEATGEAILAVDLNNNWLLCNQKFIDLWQIPHAIIAAKMRAKDGSPELLYGFDQIKNPEVFSRKVTELYATPEAQSFDIIEFKDGKIIERYSIPKMIGNQVVGRVWSFRDVTEQKRTEAELRIAATAFESQDGMSITDANQIILKVNKAFTRVTSYSPEEAIGQTHTFLNSGRHDTHFHQALQHALKQDGYWDGEIWNRRKNGEIYPVWLSITTVRDAHNRITNYVSTFSDITKDKEVEKTIHNLAYYDPLTELPNRRLLWERLKHAIEVERRDGKQLALLMLDLDRFKAINDSMGHLAGDELLQQVAARIKARLRDVDMVARLGGDEFVVLLEDITHPEDAARIAEEIVADLSKPFQLFQNNSTVPELSRKVIISASIGISLFPQHGNSPEMLMDNADIALYKAKDEGRGCFAYFSEEFTLIARQRIALEIRLRHAIEQQELCVYYQPQVDIDSGLIIGAEALVRWQDPNEGLIFPGRFIPIAEETGLIVEIGAWVLRETCRQGRRWIDAGLPPLTLAVNVSPHQFRRSDISALVAEVLNETGFPAELLELELTESGLMENEEKAVEVLNNLRAQSVRLAIDDFGTGYSSLAYLKRFPLDVLKIDKSFIDDIPSLQDDMEITATIIAMGHILGFKVLAEGVETLEQLAFLREKGCDTYQGYIKSKPLPPEEFARLLREQV